MKTFALYSFSLACLMLQTGYAERLPVPAKKTLPVGAHTPIPFPSVEPCEKYYTPYQIGLRHIEPKGIGYSKGYSTLDLFFTSLTFNQDIAGFLDLRGHIFDNSYLAANAGVGLRYVGSWILGANIYYDYRETKHHNYNQIAAGLECLGEVVDFRLNGYFPFGSKESGYYGSAFDYFQGHYLYIKQSREFALLGANAEVGFSFNALEEAPIYLAGGAYFLNGNGHTAWGGKARASLSFMEYVKLEGSASYDTIFKWIGQGELTVSIPLGRKAKVQPTKKRSCADQAILLNKAVSPVSRSEIIPVDTESHVTAAINPATGLPYYFLFLNNLSGSQGTFEDEYALTASIEIVYKTFDQIYAYHGNGNAYQGGFRALRGQRLLGASIEQRLPLPGGDTVVIPPQDPSGEAPIFTNDPATAVLALNGSNIEVSGIRIEVPDSGIGIADTGGQNNLVTETEFDFKGDNSFSVDLTNTANFRLEESVVRMARSGNRGVRATGTENTTISGNRFEEVDGANTYDCVYTVGSRKSVQVEACEFVTQSDTGVGLRIEDTTPDLSYAVRGCFFTSRLETNSEANGIIIGDGLNSISGQALYFEGNRFRNMGGAFTGAPIFLFSSIAYQELYFRYNIFDRCQNISSAALVSLNIDDDAIPRFLAVVNENIFFNSVDKTFTSFALNLSGATYNKERFIEMMRNSSDVAPIAYQLNYKEGQTILFRVLYNLGYVYIYAMPISI
ncbi:MAG: inverse autotransporter beta domain-containing protein [Verrucomicrobia bacterium]|nr:inverse autotransporter beta domain-containing protein [Verrucomicrobiota bacterium]